MFSKREIKCDGPCESDEADSGEAEENDIWMGIKNLYPRVST